MTTPYLTFTVDQKTADDLAYLVAQAKSGLSDADKKLSVAMLTEVYCALLDTCFGELLKQVNEKHDIKTLAEAQSVIEEIQSKARHYMGWISGFLATEKVVKVIHHFDSLVVKAEPGSDQAHFLKLPISLALAEKAALNLTSLINGSSTNIEQGIDILIEATDAAIVHVVEDPKRIMKFNLVVDKTLGGVIVLLKGVGYKIIRKLGKQLPEDTYAMVATHLGSFVVTK
jgi:hypothetical protein